MEDWDVYSVGYESSLIKLKPDLPWIWKAEPDIQKLADTLATRIEYGFDQYESLAFVAHSMGGLIVQRALIDNLDARKQTSHLFLFGTPSTGLLKAVIANKLSGKTQIRDMAEGGPFIVRLRRDWEKTFGYDNFPFHFRCVAGESDEFVPTTSAYSKFPDSHCLSIPGGHLDIVKPASPDQLAVRIVAKGLRERRTRRQKKSSPSADEIDPGEYLPPDILQWFLDYLHRCPPGKENISTACREAVSSEFRRKYRMTEDESWSGFLKQLLDCPQSSEKSDGLLRFFHILSDTVESRSERKDFLERINTLELHFGDDAASFEEDSEKPPLYLLVDLEPHSPESKTAYTATVYEWRSLEAVGDFDVITGEDEEIAAGLDHLIAGLGEKDQPAGIDVFLPVEWLTVIRPEKWALKKNRRFAISLGRVFPTVVRLNRHADDPHPEFLGHWKKKWCNLTASPNQDRSFLQCLCPVCKSDLQDPEALYEKLLQNEDQCLLIAPSRPAKLNYGEPCLGNVINEIGIPVALWGNVDQEEIEKLLKIECLADLPGNHREQRRKDKKAPANRITLMWDDPNRLCGDAVQDKRHLPETENLTSESLKGPKEAPA